MKQPADLDVYTPYFIGFSSEKRQPLLHQSLLESPFLPIPFLILNLYR